MSECLTPDDPCADPDACDSLACARERLHLTLRDEADLREGNVRMIETLGHLPECPAVAGWNCICDRLRACEQRTLQAARDAVAAVVHCPIAGHFGDGGCGYDAGDGALAAIDALKEEDK